MLNRRGGHSQAAYGESAARQSAEAALSSETERLARGDAEFVSEMNAIQAVARPELSHGHVPAETRQKDPTLWMPQAAPAKAPAKKP